MLLSPAAVVGVPCHVMAAQHLHMMGMPGDGELQRSGLSCRMCPTAPQVDAIFEAAALAANQVCLHGAGLHGGLAACRPMPA